MKKKRKRKGRLFSFYREEVDLYHLKSKKGAVKWHTKQKAEKLLKQVKIKNKTPDPLSNTTLLNTETQVIKVASAL
ncbi:hypothetical protein [Hoylesella nanceiensis]|uniref:hypothetical protein n=1 Tax=Hoylesella nanceiensis TaxID=425941 RepID=UPI0028E3C075|nr:hypothetical protein [Hoylesella nanceiensis]